MKTIRSEPAAFVGALAILGTAVIGGAKYGLGWSDAGTSSVLAIWNAAIGLATVTFVRSRVVPTARMDTVIHDAIVSLAQASPQSPSASQPPVIGGWYSDGSQPRETLIHVSGVDDEGCWVASTWHRGIEGTIELVGVNSRWVVDGTAVFQRCATPSDFRDDMEP